MTGVNELSSNEQSPLDEEDSKLSVEEHAINFAKVLAELDRAIIPFREHKSDLKKSYIENGWLTKEQMTAIAKAYRSLKSDEDIDKIVDYVRLLKNSNVKVG